MTMMNKSRHWVHTVDGSQVGFMYEPGANQRAMGAVTEYIPIGPEGILLSHDAVNVALNRFPGVVALGKG